MMDKLQQARLEGMDYALRIAKEKGVEGLEKDVRMRSKYNVPVGLKQSALDEMTLRVKQNMFDTLTILVDMTLHDEFGFGKKRLEQFKERFNLKADCIAENYCSWQDQIDTLREECNIKLGIRSFDKGVRT